MPIPVGAKGESSLEVTPAIAVEFLGPHTARVLGTPFLIYNLEITARNLVLPHLDPGFDSVGTLVNVRHLAATPLGMRASFHAEVLQVDDRRVLFRVEAFDEIDKIAEGTHERAIVNVERFASRVEGKRQARASRI